MSDVVIQMPPELTTDGKPAPLELDAPPPQPVDQRKGILKLTVHIPSSGKPASVERKHPAPRWFTPEFLFYYVAAVIVIPIMVWIPIRLSSSDHPNFLIYQRRLSPGWIMGRRVDNSDAQYRSFRSNIPYLGLLIALYFILKQIYTRSSLSSLSSAPSNRLYLITFQCVFSILMITALHGTSAIKIILILLANYHLGKACKEHSAAPVLTWILNGAVLYMNEIHSGYKFGDLHESLGVLDSFAGIHPRWHVNFNITMLRLVSFNMDYHWACRKIGNADTGAQLSGKQRPATYHDRDAYSFKNYIAYVLYPPLYLAGPIITFNDFIWQFKRPNSLSRSSVLRYAFRFLVSFLTMEFILHFMYVVAIKDRQAWASTSAAELSMIGFWNLIVVWLKLLLPWRFFRLWALADGVDPPENMVRCMANNYSSLGFWRSWHRSYNLWIVRYIYIPLGGTKNALFTTVLVFSFVALWHDLSFKLLAWGWLVSLFIIPEIAARAALPPSKFASAPWYRHVCALGAVFNILMMMGANLVGFVIGVDGVQYFLSQLIGTSEGIRFLIFASACLFIAAQLMFEYREEELRRGIQRRC